VIAGFAAMDHAIAIALNEVQAHGSVPEIVEDRARALNHPLCRLSLVPCTQYFNSGPEFRSATNHHANESFHRGVVRVSLPPKGESRDRWLTRKEAVALIWDCWRHREKQTIHAGRLKVGSVVTNRRPLRHIARFILIGLYTSTRAGAIASASPHAVSGRSYVDLERGVFYRKAIGKQAANEPLRSVRRQPPYRLGCSPAFGAGGTVS
jgi:hypothetical protein